MPCLALIFDAMPGIKINLFAAINCTTSANDPSTYYTVVNTLFFDIQCNIHFFMCYEGNTLDARLTPLTYNLLIFVVQIILFLLRII